MLHSLSTQGRYAVHYQFKNHSAHYLTSNVPGLHPGSVLVISSRFRTDIFYRSEEPLNEAILKVWRLLIGDELSKFHAERIKSYSGSEKVFQEFFTSLEHLHQVRSWYAEYVQEFRLVYASNPVNPIMSELIGCDRYLINLGGGTTRQCLIDEQEVVVAPKPCDFSELAMKAIANVNEN